MSYNQSNNSAPRSNQGNAPRPDNRPDLRVPVGNSGNYFSNNNSGNSGSGYPRRESPGYSNSPRFEERARFESVPEPLARRVPKDTTGPDYIQVFGSAIHIDKVKLVRMACIGVRMLKDNIKDLKEARVVEGLQHPVVFQYQGVHHCVMRPAEVAEPRSDGVIDVCLLSKHALKKVREEV